MKNLASPLNTDNLTAYGVATGDNRVNSQGSKIIKPGDTGQTSKVIATSISAGTTIPFAVSGSSFYVTAASAPINVRQKGGEFTSYVPGTGLLVVGGFASIEVQNPNNFPVSFQLFVGFDGFIDNRQYNVSNTLPNVAFPTYSQPLSAPAVAITDISGQGFFDINGNPWLALTRLAIVISNLDTATTILVQEQGSVIQNDDAIAAVFPTTSWIEALSGNFSLNVGGGNINALVHEIYSAIPPSGLAI